MASRPITSGGARRAARRRPADRRATIVATAARAFSESGYHAVRLEDIAEVAGLSAPALYRHFPTKYALFAETTRHLADALVEATAPITADPADARAELDATLDALVDAALAHRTGGGLYRWENRYLAPADAAYVRDIVVAQHRHVRGVLRRLRADLSPADADTLAAAMTSVVASPATHRVSSPATQVRRLLTTAASSLTEMRFPDPSTATSGLPHLAPVARREVLLAEAVRLFAAQGFHDVTIEQIAGAVDLPPSGVYRHFPSKAAILEAAFWRAGDRVDAVTADALATSGTPEQALTAMIAGYVGLSDASPDLMTVYVSEIGHVGTAQRSALRRQQRITVDEWATWLTRTRTGLPLPHARFLVHAALTVVHDLTRLSHRPSPARLTAIGCAVLLGPRASAGDPDRA